MAVKISKKGWIVIPRAIRARHGLKAGDRVQVVDYAGHIAIFPALEDPVRQSRGLFKDGPSLVQALIEERHREQEREAYKLRRLSHGGTEPGM